MNPGVCGRIEDGGEGRYMGSHYVSELQKLPTVPELEGAFAKVRRDPTLQGMFSSHIGAGHESPRPEPGRFYRWDPSSEASTDETEPDGWPIAIAVNGAKPGRFVPYALVAGETNSP